MLRQLKLKHKGETCVVIGNGPSLEDTPLLALGDKYVTFGANKIYTYPYLPTYWTCVDLLMLEDCKDWINLHPNPRPEAHFVSGHEYKNLRTIPLNVQLGGFFSIEPHRVVFIGGTVTYVNLQLALYMGFSKVILVGCDHSYPAANEGEPGTPFVAGIADPDHFGNAYFTEGKMYNRPSLKPIAEYFYPLALQEYWKADSDIVNCSVETTLTCFKREPLETYL